jgi:hypothetical protein
MLSARCRRRSYPTLCYVMCSTHDPMVRDTQGMLRSVSMFAVRCCPKSLVSVSSRPAKRRPSVPAKGIGRRGTAQTQYLAIGNLEYETVQELTVYLAHLNWNRNRVELYGPHSIRGGLAVAGGVARVVGPGTAPRSIGSSPPQCHGRFGRSREPGRQATMGLGAWTKLYWVLTHILRQPSHRYCAQRPTTIPRQTRRVRHPLRPENKYNQRPDPTRP